jgi:Fe-S-cluster-containing hydrogenase component 2
VAKQVVVNPRAELEPRDTDIILSEAEFAQLGLFTQLKRKPTLDKFPGALRLRYYRKGEVVCRQGESGWTAFYVLSSEDALAVREKQLARGDRSINVRAVQKEVQALQQRVASLQAAGDRADELRRALTVYLSLPRRGLPGQGLLQRLAGGLLGGLPVPERDRPATILIDAPTAVDVNRLQAPLHERELFGEMSCLHRTPRSATIVADRDCYLLEMLRNILDQLQKDPGFGAATDEAYKKRILEMHVRRLSLFNYLTEAQFQTVRDDLELVARDAGQLICDEHERSDCLYIVRSGLVKVVKKVSALLGRENIRSWGGLCAALREAEQQPTTPRGKVWQLLPEAARAAVRRTTSTSLPSAGDSQEILHGLNDLIRDPKLPDVKELQPLTKATAFQEEVRDLPANRKNWSEHEVRRYNRKLVEAVFPPEGTQKSVIRAYTRRVGPDCVLSYCSRGDFLGEMGLITGTPRSATCVAAGHPEEGKGEGGRVELVRLSAEVFQRVLEMSPLIRQKVEKLAAERRERDKKRVDAPVFEEASEVVLSERFQELGLIQGQRLMLIDLDRCTRCDECVKACVNTHRDGHSRLFLDGPRFGKYLVPTSCRSCLDPVCMIGCPVGSIHRGDNLEMVIEDWCIGCNLCAKQCPYGSIQMHDIGVIPEEARGWRYLPEVLLGQAAWYRPRFRDGRWPIGQAPFRFGPEFCASLEEPLRRGGSPAPASQAQPICFRYEFRLDGRLCGPGSQFKMEVESSDSDVKVWVNGELQESEKAKGAKREFWLPPNAPPTTAKDAPAAPAPPRRQPLRPGRNVVAVLATPRLDSNAPLLQLRLDEIHRPEVIGPASDEISEKLVTERAVVCDLCSSLVGQVPSCVSACPHDAAMRVDARSEFPVR